MPIVSQRARALARAVLVPTPSVDDTMTGSRYPAGMEIAPPKPPSPPRTSGRRVDCTASRISSTARSPTSASTPDAMYATLVGAGRGPSPTSRHRLLEHELAARGVVRDGLRVATVEAGEAELVVRQVEGREDALDRQVAQRIGADEVTD